MNQIKKQKDEINSRNKKVKLDPYQFGNWASMRYNYLHKYCPKYVKSLISNGELEEYLKHIQERGEQMENEIVQHLIEVSELTEEERMYHTGRYTGIVNMIHLQAKEVIRSEIIYV